MRAHDVSILTDAASLGIAPRSLRPLLKWILESGGYVILDNGESKVTNRMHPLHVVH